MKERPAPSAAAGTKTDIARMLHVAVVPCAGSSTALNLTGSDQAGLELRALRAEHSARMSKLSALATRRPCQRRTTWTPNYSHRSPHSLQFSSAHLRLCNDYCRAGPLAPCIEALRPKSRKQKGDFCSRAGLRAAPAAPLCSAWRSAATRNCKWVDHRVKSDQHTLHPSKAQNPVFRLQT